jgi:NodT family efflux transporter outer membrane factor (OMF) lipoprotein
MCTSANSRPSRRRSAGLAALGALAILSGCAVGPDFRAPAAPKVDRYSSGPGLAGAQLGRPTDATWWRLFGSSALDQLVEAGLKDSPTLDAARHALEQSQDQARAGAGVFYPQVSGAVSAVRERSTPTRFGQNGPASTFSLYTLTGEIDYAIDLFGGERRRVEALEAAAEAQAYALGAAHLVLAGGVVDASIARGAYADEAASLERLLRLEAAQKDILTAQAQAGHGAWSAVLGAEQQLSADRQSLAETRQRQAAATTLLAILIGREPGDVEPVAPSLAEVRLPDDLPVSLPSQLVRRRPDIRQAEALMHQANAEVGVATAALFPSISLTGDYGAASLSANKLGSQAARFWSVGPSVEAPIFQGGTLWYERKAAQAALLQAQDGYRQTVLAGLKQVADALKALESDAEVDAASASALDAALANSRLSAANLKAGAIAEYDAMSLEIAVERARLSQIGARAQRLQDVAALYVACGGGWSPDGLAGPAGASR